MQFLATSIRDGKRYSERLEAHSDAEAKRICALKDWIYEGKLMMEIPAASTTIEAVDSFVNAINNGEPC